MHRSLGSELRTFRCSGFRTQGRGSRVPPGNRFNRCPLIGAAGVSYGPCNMQAM